MEYFAKTIDKYIRRPYNNAVNSTSVKRGGNMKKLFIILFALMLVLSGCGREVKIVDPSEQIAELEKPETEKPSEENTVTEEFVEEIVLNFGAEKLGEGKYISEKTRGFLYELEIHDASNLEMKYYYFFQYKLQLVLDKNRLLRNIYLFFLQNYDHWHL